MTRDRPFEAVVLDVDGVLTRTTSLHEQAWKRMFDEFLGGRDGQQPFSSADYRAHVDGKPRYQGVADFLCSRNIEIPRGDQTDPADKNTVCGLGNRKNDLFLRLLDEQGVAVFDDAVAALERWRRGGLKLAAVSSSRNCRRVLQTADLERRFDVIVDGQLAAEKHLAGKPEIMMEATRQLAVRPSDAVVFEDATAGVRAGKKDGFGFIVGVSRNGNEIDLEEAGAHAVVSDVYLVRFLWRLPNALERIEELSALRGSRPLAIFLDFDGTLAPIVDDPSEAQISEETRSVLENLRCPMAIISGRDRADVESRVGIAGVFYAGNHGFDIEGGGHHRILPEADDALGEVDQAERELRRRVGKLTGVTLERKRYSLAIHYRQVDSESVVKEVDRAVEAVRAKTGLRKRTGKKVLELEPAVDWNKGRALKWLADVLPASSTAAPFIVYAGDDETDEDAFAALRGDGIGIRIGSGLTCSLADYHVEDPGQLVQLLRRLATLCD